MKRTPPPVPPAPPKQENPPFVPYDPATYAQDLAKVLRHIRTQIRHLSLHALALSHKLVPDIVLLDLSMPLLNGMDAIPRIQQCTTASTKILILSTYSDPAYARHAQSLGASGYLSKQSDIHLIATAIRSIHSGDLYFSPTHHLTVQCP